MSNNKTVTRHTDITDHKHTMSKKGKFTPEDIEAAIKAHDALLAEEEAKEKEKERKTALEKRPSTRGTRAGRVVKGKSATAMRLEHEKVSKLLAEHARYTPSTDFDGGSYLTTSRRMSGIKH